MHSLQETLKPDTRIKDASQCCVTSAVAISMDARSVWAVVGNFGGFQAFIPALDSTDVTGSGPGAVRKKQFKDGNFAVEQLNSYDDEALSMTWTLIHTSLPVGNLWAAMTVEPTSDDSCIATWTIVADPLTGSADPLSAFKAFLQGFADDAMSNVGNLFA